MFSRLFLGSKFIAVSSYNRHDIHIEHYSYTDHHRYMLYIYIGLRFSKRKWKRAAEEPSSELLTQ